MPREVDALVEKLKRKKKPPRNPFAVARSVLGSDEKIKRKRKKRKRP